MFALYFIFLGCNEKEMTPVPEGTEDNQENPQEPVDGVEEGEEVHTASFCTPQPNLQTLELGIDLFEQAMAIEQQSCSLTSREIDIDGIVDEVASFDPPSMECDDEHNCVHTLPSFAISWALSPELDLGERHGALTEGIVTGQRMIVEGHERILLTISYNMHGSTASRVIDRVYSSEGHLEQERMYFNEMLWFDVHNTWEGELLVQQDVYDHINNDGRHTQLRWTYDEEGRMQRSTYSLGSQSHSTADFSYDEEGRMIQLVRAVDGAIALKQSWSYSEGELVSRTSEYRRDLQWYHLADTATDRSPANYSAHWEASMIQEEDGCAKLPNTLVHGYPDAEKVYQLGWSRNDVPKQIGFGHQYDGYGWLYGDLSWFGHAGVASFYGIEGENAESFQKSTIYYQNGVMVQEDITSQGSGNHITRVRTFEDGLLYADELYHTDTVEDRETFQALKFTYDEHGNLERRDLYQDEIHTHQNTWAYNEEGYLSEYGISMLNHEDMMEQRVVYRQSNIYQEDSYEQIREKRNGEESSWERVDTLFQGVHPQGRYEKHNNRYVVFNEQGRVITQGYDHEGSNTYYSSAVDNQYGLLERWEQRDGGETTTHYYQYSCE